MEKNENWTMRDTMQLLLGMLLSGVIAIVVITNVHLTKVCGQSITPNIQDEEVLVVDCLSHKIRDSIDRYDIVVFQPEGRDDFFMYMLLNMMKMVIL